MSTLQTLKDTNSKTGVSVETTYDPTSDTHGVYWEAPFFTGRHYIEAKSSAHAVKIAKAHLRRTDWSL